MGGTGTPFRFGSAMAHGDRQQERAPAFRAADGGRA